MGPETMLIGALLCALGVPLLLLGALHVAIRGGRSKSGDGLGKARAVLHTRLASGEIDTDEYYERESALRSAAPVQRRGVRG